MKTEISSSRTIQQYLSTCIRYPTTLSSSCVKNLCRVIGDISNKYGETNLKNIGITIFYLGEIFDDTYLTIMGGRSTICYLLIVPLEIITKNGS